MAELAVAVRYETRPRKAALKLLKFTFPIWGVCAPVFAVAVMVPVYFVFVVDKRIDPSLSLSFVSTAGMLLAFVSGLLAVNWLSRDRVLIDQFGIKLPLSLLHRQRAYAWSEILKVAVSHSDARSWRDKGLVLFTSKGERRIEFDGLESQSVEKLLLALEMWHQRTDIDGCLGQLRNELLGGLPQQLSYTQMWEDELSRRFNPTAFVPLEPGRVMRNGSLRIIRYLAMGGLSAVYLAQTGGRKLVVLKEAVISDDTTHSAQAKAREMLDREAKMLLKLSHPHVVQVFDHFVEEGRDYVVLDYIGGQDLRQLVRQNGPQKESVVVLWAMQMVSALKYLHEQEPPVLHRDFTPDNLVLDPNGAIVVIDFGAANEFISTATGTFVGKHAFIAPEQFRGKAVVQSDIYALGCTLFFLLTGNEPEALAPSDVLSAGATVSPEINDLIVTCTQLDAKDRYQSAAQLLPVLKALSAGYR